MILQADASHIPLKSASVRCVVTSPPYFGLRRYGLAGELGHEASPQEFVARLVGMFAEVWRVLAEDGTVWVVLGDSYAGASASRASWDGYAGSKQRTNAGSLRDDRVFADWGACGLKPKDLIGVPWRFALAMQDAGWWLRQDVIWSKGNPMPESVRDRCTRSHEYVFMFTKAARYFYDAEAVSEPLAGDTSRRLRQADLDTQMGGHKADAYREDFPGKKHRDRSPSDILRAMRDSGMKSKNLRSVWSINTKPYPDAHFATFPAELARRCVLAGSEEGDVVLDPFCGSGTTVEVAYESRRVGVGCDLSWEYCTGHAAKRCRNGQAKGRQEVMPI